MRTYFIPVETNLYKSESVSTAGKAGNAPKNYVELVDEKSIDKNTDEIVKKSKRDQAYALLNKIADEYRIAPELLKSENFIEEITGYSNLENLSSEELNTVMNIVLNALKSVLHRDFKAFWKDRDGNDVKEIIKATRDQLWLDKTEGNWLKQVFKKLTYKSSLEKQLISAGIISDSEDYKKLDDIQKMQKIKEFFKKEYLQGLSDINDSVEKEKRYEKAIEEFGYLVANFNSVEEKSLLVAVIDELSSNKKAFLYEAMLNTCGTDTYGRAKVAKNAHATINTAKKDALNEAMSKDDAQKVHILSYGNMFEEDAEIARKIDLDNSSKFILENKDKLEEIRAKLNNGCKLSDLTEEEQYIYNYYNNEVVAKHSGIILGINQNTNYSLETARNAISETAENAHRNNFSNEVIENVTNYTANNNQTEVKFNTEEIVEIVNKVVNNKPSEAIIKDDNKVDKKLNENAEAINVNNSEKAEIEVVNKKAEKVNLDKRSEISVDNPIKSAKTTANKEVAKKEENIQEDKKEKIALLNSETDFRTFINIAGRSEGLDLYIEEHGILGLSEAFNNLDKANKTKVGKMFKMQNAKTQFEIIDDCNYAGFNLAANLAKEETTLMFNGKTFSCSDITKMAQKKFEDLKIKKEESC